MSNTRMDVRSCASGSGV